MQPVPVAARVDNGVNYVIGRQSMFSPVLGKVQKRARSALRMPRHGSTNSMVGISFPLARITFNEFRYNTVQFYMTEHVMRALFRNRGPATGNEASIQA